MTETDLREAEEVPAPTEHVSLSDPEFKTQLAQVIPHLRAFGRSLSGNRDLADDLVQETLLKAWAARKRFQAGTNMRAWTFIILRNLYLSQMRRARFKGEWDDLVADRILAAPASQDKHVELADMQRALLHLPQPQREALILVGAGGFAYEEAAEICKVAVGTIKSRVARGEFGRQTGIGGVDVAKRATDRIRRAWGPDDVTSAKFAIVGGGGRTIHDDTNERERSRFNR
jgi:RNA polymerase sigma factor (sigma-70 family)